MCDKVGQKFKCLCNLIGWEAQEGAEKTINLHKPYIYAFTSTHENNEEAPDLKG